MADARACAQALLYKIKKGDKVSYLFGTMHLSDPEVTSLSAEAKAAFEGAERLVIEDRAIYDAEERQAYKRAKEDLTFAWHRNQDMNTNTLLKSEGENPYKRLNRQCPDAFLQTPVTKIALLGQHLLSRHSPFDKGPFLDQLLALQAKERSLPIFGLENLRDRLAKKLGLDYTYQQQTAYFHYFYPRLLKGRYALELSLSREAYLQRDLKELMRIISSSFELPADCPPEVKSIQAELNRQLLEVRDQQMAQNMEEHLQAGKAFIAVGSAHLPGILNLIKAKGYEIEAVTEGPRLYSLTNNRLPPVAPAKTAPFKATRAHLDKALASLIKITDHYLAKSASSAEKLALFQQLKRILCDNPGKATYTRLEDFGIALGKADQKMIAAHRTEDWKRYLYNAISILTLIPGLVRVSLSYYRYNSCRFWKADSAKAFRGYQSELTLADRRIQRIRPS